ncbi:cell wall assembly regulator SMI1 [Pontibacter aydingkolensis]|uniref:SMI1/KNR4 family protein n=1 Tax=Pontibacter aydingkolensis TaxID=1911536 RepID=A0ABS7CQ97_9BACT|nr:SMI1/KNR4 family protein [Pontibacter aydingkolensis]MBW7465973.1 SMI1/KNR4 family protein [Pontibacter aydingkolensis]
MSNTWIGKTIEQWEIDGVELNVGASLEAIKNAERVLNFIFPLQFQQLYVKANGFNNLDWIENVFSIWPIERMLEEFNESTNKDFIGFADYSMNVHQIGFVRGKEGVYKYCDNPVQFANTFEEAISLINSDDETIY